MADWTRRIFLSHTAELREHPRDHSFIAAAEAAVIRAGHVVTDMAYFTAHNAPTAEYCKYMVGQAHVYVAIVGLRYGTLVRDRPTMSYTELEFEAATEHRLPRLIFILDEDAVLPLPASQIVDLEYGPRQSAFRRRLREASLAVGTVASPGELETRLYQALVEMSAVRGSEPTPAGGVVGGSIAVPLGRLPVEVRGRDELLRSLVERRGLVVLAGLGGVGKSTVAAELARIVQPTRQAWWVPSGDASSLLAGLVTVARRLGAETADLEALASHAADGPDRLWAALDRAHEGWLLVLDDADQPDMLAAPADAVANGTSWFRASDRGLVLVTSRQAEPATWGSLAQVHRLLPLSDASAASVLLDMAPHAGGHAEAMALGSRLGGLPLALHLAGSYLGSGIGRWRSFASYQEALERTPAATRVLRPDPDSAVAGDPRTTLMSTWELSLDDLSRRGLPHARSVLRMLSCFAPAVPIPLDVLQPAYLAALLTSPAGAAAGRDAADLDARLEQALRGLARVGLVDTIAGQGAVIVHPTICAINRAHLMAPAHTRDPVPHLVRGAAAAVVVAAVDALHAAQPTDWPRFRSLLPHLLALLSDSAPHLDAERAAALVATSSTVAVAFHQFGVVSMAMDLTSAALGCAPRLGEDHPAILEARNNLALELRWQGRLAEAQTVLEKLLVVEREVLGPDHPVTLATRHQLARTAATRGRYEEAETTYRDVLEAERRLVGDGHPATFVSRHELARTIARRGRTAEAELLLRDLLAAETAALGANHPDTLATRYRWARAIGDLGRAKEAEEELRTVLLARQSLLGDHHHLTLSTQVQVALCRAGQGHMAEAESTLLEVLDVRRRLLGDDHPSTLSTRHHLGLTLGRAGRWSEAEEILASVFQRRRRALGDDHPSTLATGHFLALALARLGRRDEAEAILVSVLDGRRRTLGNDHPHTAATLAVLGERNLPRRRQGGGRPPARRQTS